MGVPPSSKTDHTTGFYKPEISTWGGSIIYSPELDNYVIFMALMMGNCGLDSWMSNSAVFMATSTSKTPLGPYDNEVQILDYFAHGPTATIDPITNEIIVWHIGDAGKDDPDAYNDGCDGGFTPGGYGDDDDDDSSRRYLADGDTWPLPAKQINAAVAPSINGPWTETGIMDATDGNTDDGFKVISSLDDPAPIHLKNGTTWVMGRAWQKNEETQLFNTSMGIARSDTNNWNSTYTTKQEVIPQFVNISTPWSDPANPPKLEDAFFWVRYNDDDSIHSFHAILHNMVRARSERRANEERTKSERRMKRQT